MKTNTAITLKSLIAYSSIPAPLIRAVVRQLGGWESFTEKAHDIASHGIDGGFHGFIYNRDTEAFAKRNRAHIAAMASQQADEFGTGVIEMVQGFGCFRHSKPTQEEVGTALYAGKDDGAGVLNALAWYAGEEVCRAYVDMSERE
jgi:hypothetical protein